MPLPILPLSLSDQEAEVELDDVWFAYPSRPNHMVLKVTTARLCQSAFSDCLQYSETYSAIPGDKLKIAAWFKGRSCWPKWWWKGSIPNFVAFVT